MTKVQTAYDKKADSIQLVKPMVGGAAAPSEEAGLMEEFSQILDKIAQHLAKGKQDVDSVDIFAIEQAVQPVQFKAQQSEAKPVSDNAGEEEVSGDERQSLEGRGEGAIGALTNSKISNGETSDAGLGDESPKEAVDGQAPATEDVVSEELPAQGGESEVVELESPIESEERVEASVGAEVEEPLIAAPAEVSDEHVEPSQHQEEAPVVVEEASLEGAPAAAPAPKISTRHVSDAASTSSAAAPMESAQTASASGSGALEMNGANRPIVEELQRGPEAASAQRIQEMSIFERSSAAEKAVPFTTFMLQGQGGVTSPLSREAIAQSILKPGLDGTSVGRAHEISAASKGSSGQNSSGLGGDAGMMRGMQAQAKGDAPVRQSKSLSRSAALRTLEKVERALEEVARSKDGKTISLNLEPVNLGKVKVDVSIRDGSLHARLSAESAEVKQLLREHAFELQSILRKVGLHVDSVSVSVSSENGMFDASSNSFERRESAHEGDDARMSGKDGFEGPAGLAERSSPRVVDDHWIA